MKILKKLGAERTIAVPALTFPFDEENVQYSSFVLNEVCKNMFKSTHQSTTTSTTNAIQMTEKLSSFNATLVSMIDVNFVLHKPGTFLVK